VFKGGLMSSHSMQNGLSWNEVKALGFDARTNTMWAAVGEMDINAFDGGSWKVYMDIREGVRSILCDTQSRVWFGSASGLMKFNGTEWISEVQKLGIPATQVNQIQRDGEGNLWFGTESGVIFLKNPYPF
jgi:ligand-binding sensor domain-containing protein